ncbi:GntR family transcriptional regulator [Mycolicibacter heraklionensis]|uniref:GntR family transcriptional regulator n=1 Tax=Mycolicibacter heraklionensis TaxID=512402 RepID=A0A9X7WK92_9MYCO|nr:GntR family transcriptional regulator [Mycolicibacter heraklionensis]KLO27640.1 GntR family transcriptional regulator [Mycolicibacter heraklionensis]QZA09039.1 GntR family transcriptional regulator [Mycolicibacter heraklionensis]
MDQSSPIPQPQRQRLDEQIATSIIEAIVDGAFPPGSVLPPERDLAEQLGVNRTSLRQALARLQHMGLIEARQGSGNLVREPAALTDPAIVEVLLRKLGPDFLAELLEIREALGLLIGDLAVSRGTPEDLAALHPTLEFVRAADTPEALQAAELAFFAVLIHATHNRALALMFGWVQQGFGGRSHELTAAFDDPTAVRSALAAIAEAAASRDAAETAVAMRAHLQASGHRMLAAARQSGAG